LGFKVSQTFRFWLFPIAKMSRPLLVKSKDLIGSKPWLSCSVWKLLPTLMSKTLMIESYLIFESSLETAKVSMKPGTNLTQVMEDSAPKNEQTSGFFSLMSQTLADTSAPPERKMLLSVPQTSSELMSLMWPCSIAMYLCV